MPAPFLGAMLGLAGAGINAFSQHRANVRSEKFSRSMYNLQRGHSIDDWNRQNQYNDPTAQMARLKRAGLNPALMYGKSASPGIASPVRSSDIKNAQFDAPQYGDTLQYMPQMFDFEIKTAQGDLLKEQVKTEAVKRALTAAQAAGAKTDSEVKGLTKQISVEAARAALDKTQSEIDMNIDENTRRQLLAGATIQEKLTNALKSLAAASKDEAEVKRIEAMIEGIKHDATIKKHQAELWEQKINPNDGLLIRILAGWLGSGSWPELKKKLEGKAMDYLFYKRF